MHDDVFVLLDDDHASAARPTSRLYTGFVRELRCIDPAGLDAACAAVQDDLAQGWHAVLLADYEWGAKLTGGGTARLAPDDRSALRVLVFADLRRLSAAEAAAWLAAREGHAEAAPAGVAGLHADIPRAAYERGIARVHEAIRDGETYQVNYTYRLHGEAWGSPVALYRRLRARQRVAFGALMRLPVQAGDAVEWVLSRSPELFVEHAAGRLRARPMKGTAPRAGVAEGDSETARLLHEDLKNRAENLMIVDLLRNDLGRVARVGSVTVPELFRVEPYSTVFQMTSEIVAARRPEVDLAALLRALFPCGSITGAPKRRTMDWIAELEPSPRGLYTGAIGWLEAGADGACPDLCLSVAIRTLTLGPASPAGLRPLALGVGGGIVQDSVAADEWDETHWKARFLTALDPGLGLIETMRAEPGGVALLARHRARLAASAAALGFEFDARAFGRAVERACAQMPPGVSRLRVLLSHDGHLGVSHAPLAPLQGPVRVILADAPLAAARPLARHKTSDRAWQDAAVHAAEVEGAFDILAFGAEGELLEGGRSSVFVRLDGRWFTPPLDDGVLAGVMRGVLLDDPAWGARERRITRDELARAQDIVVCNALRGPLRATLVARHSAAA